MSNCIKPIMQGDSYFIPIIIKNKSTTEPIDISEVSRVEVVLGNLKKYYGQDDDEIEYDLINHRFLFPLSQKETLNFNGPQHLQIRVKRTDGVVIGKIFGSILIQFSDSEVIL